MEGTGAEAGESFAWAIANPAKVSVIYARNALIRSLMSKTQPNRKSGTAAGQGRAPILHDCGVSTHSSGTRRGWRRRGTRNSAGRLRSW